MIGKGTISSLYDNGRVATIKPYLGEVVTPKLVVHYSLLECLSVGMPVVYAVFADGTGIVLARMDGEWNHKMWDGLKVVTGDVEIEDGDIITDSVQSYNEHVHNSTDGTTSEPY